MTEFDKKIKHYCELVDTELDKIVSKSGYPQQIVFDAMKYSISAGGKRIRPVLLLEFCRVCGGEVKNALPFACALEMIHTYSLIHDDLPCMDNDDFRRGKPSCHKTFGEANALLAGDALLNLAFETMLSSECDLDADIRLKAAAYIAKCSGVYGMIGGQVIDLQNEGKDIPEELLIRLYKDKTAALLRAAAVGGVILANADEKKINSANEFAEKIGLAFQIVDDILDFEGDEATLGKPVGSDEKNNKKTYVAFHGIENAKEDAKALTTKAIEALENFDDTEFLRELALFLCTRKK